LVYRAPVRCVIEGSQFGHYLAALGNAGATNMELIMIVIPNNKSVDLYSMVKKKCTVEMGVPSQVVTATVLAKDKGLLSVVSKIAIQMQAKLGGEPWYVKIPVKKTMVVGYDVYHDTEKKGTSVGALVCSLNDTFTRYYSEVDFHSSNTEVSSNVNSSLMNGLKKYQEVNKCFPDRIFVYRDGVGDGQIQFVYEHELRAMRKALKDVVPTPKLTFIIVSKRINTRFFAKPDKTKGFQVPGNPPSGTVVDDVVTLPERYDFYVISQSVRQGTVSPTSYNVIHDEIGFKPEQVQKLTYKLTHLYYNWQGTVRVPAPCQYAHKLAYQTGTALHLQAHSRLSNRLHFL